MKRWNWAAAAAALYVGGAAWGQAPAAQTAGLATGGRNILVLVASLPGGLQQLGVNYPATVPRAQALRDFSALQTETGGGLSRPQITDAKNQFGHKTTELTCDAIGLVRPETHGLAVEPYVRALRPYPNVILTYFVGKDFQFRGLRDFADSHVRIRLDQHGAAYTYQITIRDPRFDRLNLPYLQPAGVDPASVRAAEADRRKRGWLLALVAALALGTGGVVYAVLSRNS